MREVERIQVVVNAAVLVRADIDLDLLRSYEQCMAMLRQTQESRGRLCGDLRAAAVRGGMMVFYPLESLFDGLSQDKSQGFFDINNCPPLLCWLDVVRYTEQHCGVPREGHKILAWVPECLVERADCGISANAEGCIEWLTHGRTTDTLVRQLLDELRAGGVEFVVP